MAESIGKPNFSANEEPTVKLKKVPLIGSAQDVVVVKSLRWRTDAVCERTPEISGVGATSKNEH